MRIFRKFAILTCVAAVLSGCIAAIILLSDKTPSIQTMIRGKGIPVTLQLVTATTPEKREQGLMNITRLAPYDGMVFFFPKPAPLKFWMKNTPLPLDMLFVDEAGRIVYIGKGVPHSEIPVGPESVSKSVIEIEGGRAAKLGIAVGDKVEYDNETYEKLEIR